MLKLRDYQREAVDAVFESWQDCNSALVVAPTGTGKTIMMCGIVKRAFPRRVMIVAHREELIFQAKESVEKYAGVLAEVEMADFRSREQHALFDKAPVVVTSVQTQNSGGAGDGRMTRFDPHEFGLLIIDEAHHAPADSYRRIIKYYSTNPDLKILGVTATPDRADEKALGQVFDTVAYDYEILDAIEGGWLVPIKQQMIEVDGLDFSSVRTLAGDLNGRDLAEVMEYEQNLHGIASPTLEIVGDRRALVFATTVDHAERLAEIFNRHRPGCAGWICGKTPKDDRRSLLENFARGELQYMVNVGCLTEGFDDAGVEVVAVARPTKSRCLYAQMVGRGTRPVPGLVDQVKDAEGRKALIAGSDKPELEVLDFVGNAGRHKLMSSADILGGKESDEVIELAKEHAREIDKPVDMRDEIEKAAREIEKRKKREAAKRARLKAKAEYSARTVDPFAIWDISPTEPRRWERRKKLSDKQAAVLRKQGIEPDGRSYHECKQILDELFRRWDGGLATLGQAKHLKRYGIDTDISKEQASIVLTGIWKEKLSPEQALEKARKRAPKAREEEYDAVPF